MVAEIIVRHDACDGVLEVLDAVSSAILALAPDGTVVFANERAVSLFRAHRHAVAGVSLLGSNVARWLAPLEQLLDGQARDARPTVSLLTERGPLPLGYTLTRAARADAMLHVLSFQDLTRVRALEEERDRLLRLATVGEVMPMLLHETKNPLAAACTLIELLIEEREEPALQSDLHAILVEIRRALLSLEGLGSAGRDLRTSTPHAVDHAIHGRRCAWWSYVSGEQNTRLSLLGILPTMVELKKEHAQAPLVELWSGFEGVLDTTIPRSDLIARASLLGVPIAYQQGATPPEARRFAALAAELDAIQEARMGRSSSDEERPLRSLV